MHEGITGECLRCGKCCERLTIKYSPERLREMYHNWHEQGPTRDYVYDIHLIYPMLRFIEKIDGKYIYSCVHLKKSQAFDITSCGVQDIKPGMCMRFPELGDRLPEGCGYSEKEIS